MQKSKVSPTENNPLLLCKEFELSKHGMEKWVKSVSLTK